MPTTGRLAAKFWTGQGVYAQPGDKVDNLFLTAAPS